MGFRIVSLAAKHRDRASFLDDLGLVATGATVTFPDEQLAGAQIGDWYVIQVLNSNPYRGHVDDPLLVKLSATADIVACGIHENNGSSFVTTFGAGTQIWSMLHEANLDGRHLVSEGNVPPEMAAFAKGACEFDPDEEEDEGIDLLFNVSIDLCERLTGFRYDSIDDALRWDVLREKTRTPARDEADRYMEVEGKPTTQWPLALQARAAIDAMTPNGGPGFVILQGANGDYMQTAGGDGAYLAEWREHAGGTFRHWVAGLKGVVIPGRIKIATNGAHVTVRRNEKLSADEVKRLATAFLRGEPRPTTFAWRDNTDMFR